MPIENTHADNLAAARSLRKIPKSPTAAAKSALQELKLTKYVQIEDFIFVGFAVTVAIIKDLLDYVAIGSLPGIGTVITIIASIAIAAAMFLAGANSPNIKAKRKIMKRHFRRYGALVFGTLAEMIFGIDFLPIETLMTLYLYRLILQERRSQAEAK